MERELSKLEKLDLVFSPSAPINTDEFFYGRIKQLEKVVDAVRERGQHAVLYGERGVGKTSLANIIDSRLRGIFTFKVTCNRTETFKDIWIKIFKKVTFVQKTQGAGFQPIEKEELLQFDLFLDKNKEVDP